MLLVWDYFGVLCHDDFWDETARLAREHRSLTDLRQARRAIDLGQMSWERFCKEVAEDTGVPVRDVVARYQRHTISPRIVSLIHELKNKGHRHVVLSNASSQYLIPIMKDLGLFLLFERVFVSSDMGVAKPAERAFRYVLSEMDVPAERAMMIDDSPYNLAGAATVGMQTFLYEANALEKLRRRLAE